MGEGVFFLVLGLGFWGYCFMKVWADRLNIFEGLGVKVKRNGVKRIKGIWFRILGLGFWAKK